MKPKSILTALALVSISSVSLASNAAGGYVQKISVSANGIAYFHQSGVRDTPPACQASFPDLWAFDSTNAAGQAKLSLIIAAHALHHQVIITGSASCTPVGDVESPGYIETVD